MGDTTDHGAPGRSMFQELTALREAVLLLCDLQRELAVKVEAALNNNPIVRGMSHDIDTPSVIE
jgi:hypothetical protein